MHQMPPVLPLQVAALRHRGPRQPSHDSTVNLIGLRAALEHAERQIARPRGEALRVGLLLGPVALRSGPVAGGASLREQLAGARLSHLVEGRLRRNGQEAGAAAAVLVGLVVGVDCERPLRKRLHVVDEPPPRLFGQVRPGGHRRPRHAPRDRAEHIVVGRHAVPSRDDAKLAAREIAWTRIQQIGRVAFTVAGSSVAGDALFFERLLALCEQFGRTR